MTCAKHNRLSCEECGVVPKPMVEVRRELREALAEFMAKHALVRMEYEDPDVRMTLERHPSAFVAPVVPDAEPAQEPLIEECACGHSLATEHNPEGCLRGCSVDMCNTTQGMSDA